MEGALSGEMAQRTKSLLSSVAALWRLNTIRTRAELVGFLASRAAHVGQHALYGYLKTRMGTQWREHFQDAAMAEAIENAQRAVFLACLSDLTVFAARLLGAGAMQALALYEDAAREALGHLPDHDFAERAADWASDADPFTTSPVVLVEFAPVAAEMKRADQDIIKASLRYRWIEVRRQLRARCRSDVLSGNL